MMNIKKVFYGRKTRVFVTIDGNIMRYREVPYQSKHRFGGMKRDARKVEIK